MIDGMPVLVQVIVCCQQSGLEIRQAVRRGVAERSGWILEQPPGPRGLFCCEPVHQGAAVRRRSGLAECQDLVEASGVGNASADLVRIAFFASAREAAGVRTRVDLARTEALQDRLRNRAVSKSVCATVPAFTHGETRKAGTRTP